MTYAIHSRNFEIGEKTRTKIEERVKKLEKLFPPNVHPVIGIALEKSSYTAEITLMVAKRIVRAEVSDTDMMAALDKACETIEKQIIRYKGRMRIKMRKNGAFKAEYESIPVNEEDLLSDETNEIHIEKNKKFELRPMDSEEAIMQMELLDHTFFVFMNSETNEVNVVYKRKNNTYGLIEPDVH